MRSIVRAGIASAGIAFGIAGACTFPDPATEDPSGSGGAPAGSTTSVVGSSSSGTTDPSTSSTTSSVGGGDVASSSASTSSTSDGGGGSSSTGDIGGGGSSSEGGGGGTLVGVGGGVTDVACKEGPNPDCVPFPGEGSGGSGGTLGSGGGNPDCDGDGDPNDEDCQPCNPDVFHGQTEFFDESFSTFQGEGAVSFNYNCVSGEEKEFVYQPGTCTAYTAEQCPDDDDDLIYVENPVCGESANTQACQVTGAVLGALGSCGPLGGTSSMVVRCR